MENEGCGRTVHGEIHARDGVTERGEELERQVAARAAHTDAREGGDVERAGGVAQPAAEARGVGQPQVHNFRARGSRGAREFGGGCAGPMVRNWTKVMLVRCGVQAARMRQRSDCVQRLCRVRLRREGWAANDSMLSRMGASNDLYCIIRWS